jgi:dihydropteroate synthase
MSATLEDILHSHRTGRAVVVGILNVTPDSFSDGGEFFSPPQAVARAKVMTAEGADVIDVGAESTRPGSDRLGPAEQIARLQDVLLAVAGLGAAVSIDTTSAQVAAFALDCGAAILNDISAGRDDPAMFALAARRGAAMVLMHMAGQPKTMQIEPHYDDVVVEVRAFLAERIAAAGAAGVPAERLIVDPGLGFGKRTEHNLALLAGLDKLAELGRPVMVGASRKRFIGQWTGASAPADRLGGSLAACLLARRRGATLFRVHDVAATVGALKTAAAIENAQKV